MYVVEFGLGPDRQVRKRRLLDRHPVPKDGDGARVTDQRPPLHDPADEPQWSSSWSISSPRDDPHHRATRASMRTPGRPFFIVVPNRTTSSAPAARSPSAAAARYSPVMSSTSAASMTTISRGIPWLRREGVGRDPIAEDSENDAERVGAPAKILGPRPQPTATRNEFGRWRSFR